MKKEIENKNDKGQYHGYQEYHTDLDKVWLRANYKNGEPLGYNLNNPDYGGIGDNGTRVEFYIR